MKIKLSYLERRRFVVMLFCVLVAVGSWMFLTLNNNYVYSVKTVVKYINAPQNKAFHALQSDTVELQVEGSGWHLLFAKMRIAPPSIAADLHSLNAKDYILFSNQLLDINKNLENSSQKVISVKPDTLFFDFSRKAIKYVPVKLISNLDFKKPYQLSDSIKIFPKTVKIMGSIDELKKINYWPTDTLNLQGINESTSLTISLKKLNNSSLNIEPEQVKVSLPVDEFTEKTIEVPLRVINNVNYRKIKLLPRKAKITFMVSLSDYQKINEDFMEASVDISDWEKNHTSQLSISLTRFPDFCKLVTIEPQKVDFFIDKK